MDSGAKASDKTARFARVYVEEITFLYPPLKIKGVK